jgi:DNA-binding HxlR family transcriptional regulator
MHEATRSVLGRKWTTALLKTLAEESPQNYSSLEGRFDTSSDVVTDTLQLLAKYDLVERQERSHRDVRYSITSRGRRFLKGVNTLETLLQRDT